MGRYKSAFQKLKSRISKHAKAKGVSKLYLWVDFAWSFVVYGCSPTEYILYDFCELRHCSKRKFLTMRNSRKLEQIFEDPDYASTFNDKALFNQTFSDFVRRRWLICSKDTTHTPGGVMRTANRLRNSSKQWTK